MSQRDLIIKLHGGLFAVITVAGPAIAGDIRMTSLVRLVLVYLALGAALLALISLNSLRGVQGLRMLQFEMYSAIRYSRLPREGEPQRETYFSYLIKKPEVRPLKKQLDPMGLTVSSVRHFLLADAFVAPAAAAAAAIVGRSPAVGVALAAIGVVAGAMSSAVCRRFVDRGIERLERETTDHVVTRYRELHLDV